MNDTFIDENEKLLSSLGNGPVNDSDVLRLRHRLTQANERLKAVVDQAQAQFKAGDAHATFNKQTIEKLNEPLFHGKPKEKKKYLWNPT
jgi:Holliday junction resolvasome RuvABC endonuclease subunit